MKPRKPRDFWLCQSSMGDLSVRVSADRLIVVTRHTSGNYLIDVDDQKRMIGWLKRNVAHLEARKK
jgi:hypothetical protein